MQSQEISNALKELANPATAEQSRRFFKTGKGEYGEKDIFLGIRVPVLRKQARKYKDVSLEEIKKLLMSPLHEERLCALFVLIAKFCQGNPEERKTVFDLYLTHTQYVNNWDLVDSSAHHIVGAYLEEKNKRPIYKLAHSDDLWERRIAMLATFHLIKKNEYDDALKVAKILRDDQEDLIHKAVGWMLREIGKRDVSVEKAFLKKHYKKMPRTMLRYAIEKFPETSRKQYLQGKI